MNQDQILISKSEIKAKVIELSKIINQDYQNKKLVVLGVLKGSFILMADLIRNLDLQLECEFIKIKSYQNNQSTGEVKIENLDEKLIFDKDILVIEDIVDTGLTLNSLIQNLKSKKPKSIKILSLLVKEQAENYLNLIDYYGFIIPNDYVYGYGLDDNGFYRNLSVIKKKS
jgi:hypoxanthine phosphoribosyltransferase